jgi:periplasmic protein TonB
MERPQVLILPRVIYPLAAREHHIEGTLIAKCVMTEEGTLDHCWIVRPLRYFNQVVLAALEKARYSPARLTGKPIAVFYTIPFKFKLQ